MKLQDLRLLWFPDSSFAAVNTYFVLYVRQSVRDLFPLSPLLFQLLQASVLISIDHTTSVNVVKSLIGFELLH